MNHARGSRVAVRGFAARAFVVEVWQETGWHAECSGFNLE
jgi:hypothetical protein